MSTALFIVPERQVEGLDHFVDGKALGRSKHLQRLAGAARVTPLEEFLSVGPDEAAAMVEAFGGEPPVDGFAAESWFEAAEGLRTVRGMIRCLSGNPGALADADAVLHDLREFEEVLSELGRAGVRWHLAVDF